MGFSGVFSNIDFQAPNRQAAREQAQFLNILGQAQRQANFNERIKVAQAQQAQDQANFERQMALKEKQAQALDFGQMGQQAIYNAAIERGATPEQAALSVMNATQKPKLSFDEYGRPTTTMPTDLFSMTGMANPFTQPAESMQAPQGAMQPSTPMSGAQAEAQAVFSGEEPAFMPSQAAMTSPKVDVKGGEEFMSGAAKEFYDLRGRAREKEEARPAVERGIINEVAKFKETTRALDEAAGMVQPYTAGMGSIFASIPGTPAKDLEAKLKTVKADAAFGALQAMRNASKTGGALGQVSERELGLLESAQAPLDQAQSPQELRQALLNYKNARLSALQRVGDAFEQDYGYRPKEIDSMIGEMSSAPIAFGSIEEAESANLKKGTKVIINGREGVVE